jgi:uncharacterized protein
MTDIPAATDATPQANDNRKWVPLAPRQRRVLGVLVEKAKTTPDVYPMSLAAIVTGCNQKNNRQPVMTLEADDVQEVLDQLRALGAVAEVIGSGRVPRYRHYLSEWLDVNKYELAVMAELLLRGEQTLGELRTRASRMETIDSLESAKEIVDRLIAKELIQALTPEGRGQIITHNLYKDRELPELVRRFSGSHQHPSGEELDLEPSGADDGGPPVAQQSPTGGSSSLADRVHQLEQQVALLRQQVDALRQLIED